MQSSQQEQSRSAMHVATSLLQLPAMQSLQGSAPVELLESAAAVVDVEPTVELLLGSLVDVVLVDASVVAVNVVLVEVVGPGSLVVPSVPPAFESSSLQEVARSRVRGMI